VQTALLDVDYDKDLPAHIQLVPNEELMPAYEADYNEMKKSFIYGDTLNFRELMEKIKILQVTKLTKTSVQRILLPVFYVI
jgi:hypothetical protein